MPCLNESESIGACIEKIQDTFAAFNSQGEIVVCDNGSTDSSVTVTERLGARVAHQPIRGYGNAYLKRFACARGVYLIMGDGVGSCGMERTKFRLKPPKSQNQKVPTKTYQAPSLITLG